MAGIIFSTIFRLRALRAFGLFRVIILADPTASRRTSSTALLTLLYMALCRGFCKKNQENWDGKDRKDQCVSVSYMSLTAVTMNRPARGYMCAVPGYN